MDEKSYKYLQDRLSNNKYEAGYKEGIAAAKSILSEFYHSKFNL